MRAFALTLPMGVGESFRGSINILDEKACLFKEGTTKGGYTEEGIPEEMAAAAAKAKEAMVDLAAEADDVLIEKYLEEGELTREEVIDGLVTLVRTGDLYPVFCGSAVKTCCVQNLLDGLVDFAPDPCRRG